VNVTGSKPISTPQNKNLRKKTKPEVDKSDKHVDLNDSY
jgi:hypothetical protein